EVTMEELGGARTHSSRSGNSHYLAHDEADALEFVRDLLSPLPQNNLDDPPVHDSPALPDVTDEDRELDVLVPDGANQPYDMHQVVRTVLDDGEFLEVHELFARNMIVGFGRVDGRSVGVVGNQPLVLAGCLDID